MKSQTNKYQALFFKVGLALSLGLALLAFEWKSFEKVSDIDWNIQASEFVEEELPPVTEQKRTPPPPKMPVIKEVPDEDPVEEKKLEEMFEPIEEEDPVEEFEPEEVEEEKIIEIAPKVFDIVEKSAQPGSFYQYMKRNLKYPKQAKRLQIEGKVFVQFVVDTDGSITNIKLVKGIGGGCDEEALRILENSPKWEPAKQRGRAVKQRMTFPIRFSLK